MFINTSKRLIRLYGDIKLYVTEIQFDRNHIPVKVYVFLTEYNTEVELSVDAVLRTNKVRSRNQTMLLIRVPGNEQLLLIIDHNRGNHFACCQQNTYNRLIKTIGHSNVDSSKLSYALDEAAAAAEPAKALDSLLQNKFIIIDTQVIQFCLNHLQDWVRNNEILLSPYFKEELPQYINSPSRVTEIVDTIEDLKHHSNGRLITDYYVDATLSGNIAVDLSNEHEYLLALASQQPITRSQLIIVSTNEDFLAKSKIHGFAVYQPAHQTIPQYLPQQESALNEIQSPNLLPLFSEVLDSTVTDTGFPSRSHKHRSKKHSGGFRQWTKNLRTALYHLFI